MMECSDYVNTASNYEHRTVFNAGRTCEYDIKLASKLMVFSSLHYIDRICFQFHVKLDIDVFVLFPSADVCY